MIDDDDTTLLEKSEHTRWQLKTVCVELAILLARIGVAYWIFTLAMLGTRVVDSYEIRMLSQGALVACSMLWLFTEVFFLKPYYPIWDDACDGWEILASKAKCAIKAWKECKVGEKE